MIEHLARDCDAAARRPPETTDRTTPANARETKSTGHVFKATARRRPRDGLDGDILRAQIEGARSHQTECCADQRITRRLDEDDDDDQESSHIGDAAVPEGLTAEEVVAFKKARRKEQCRVNQANYRKRKRAFEQQVDREIGALRSEIQALTLTRNKVRSKISQKPPKTPHRVAPLDVVQDFYFQFTRAALAWRSAHRSLPPRPIDTIIGLQHERFSTLDELFDVWQGYSLMFDVFELRLLSVQESAIGDSVLVSAHAELRSSIHSHAHAQRLALRLSPTVSCTVVQRFLFDGTQDELVVIDSEVDWIPAFAASPSSPASQIRSALELIEATPARAHTLE